MLKILFLENDTTILAYFKILIQKKFNCDVYTAINGVEGIKVLKNIKPDLILLDLFMPIMSGIEFLKKIRQDKIFSQTPVLIISAVKDVETISNLIGLRIEDYILKPIDIEIAFDRIKKAIDKIKSSNHNTEISNRINTNMGKNKNVDDPFFNEKEGIKNNKNDISDNNIENYEELADADLSDSEKDRAYAKILGLKGKIPKTDIKIVYKNLIGLYHPDKVNHLGKEIQIFAEKKTKDLNKAYSYFKKKYKL